MPETSHLPINYLNHLTYCPRRFWYMHVQGEIAVNAPMLEGNLLHQRADTPGRETDDRGRNVRRRVWVWHDQLNIAGFADFVEADGLTLIPVEYKHGKQGQWDNDQIQLCAQALCLETMLNQTIKQGEIFYWRSRRRITVAFDTALRQLTYDAIHHAHALLDANQLPAPIDDKRRCKHCSLQPICLPHEVAQLQEKPNG